MHKAQAGRAKALKNALEYRWYSGTIKVSRPAKTNISKVAKTTIHMETTSS